jgi:hypothetical protein
MKAYGGLDIYIYPRFLDLGTSWRSATRPDHFTTSEKAPNTYWIGGLVDSRAGLDNVEKIY